MSSSNSGGGCLGAILTVIAIWVLWAVLTDGLSTPWGKIKVDLDPPTIHIEQTDSTPAP